MELFALWSILLRSRFPQELAGAHIVDHLILYILRTRYFHIFILFFKWSWADPKHLIFKKFICIHLQVTSALGTFWRSLENQWSKVKPKIFGIGSFRLFKWAHKPFHLFINIFFCALWVKWNNHDPILCNCWIVIRVFLFLFSDELWR